MTAIIGLVIQGLAVLPGILGAVKSLFGLAPATAQQKADALTTVAGSVLSVVGSVSKGGQAETIQKAAQVIPMFHDLTENLMMLAEASGKPGSDKQAYVTGIVTAAMQGWEQLSTGAQAATVQEIKPVVNQAVNVLVPVLFPHPGDIAGVGTQGQ